MSVEIRAEHVVKTFDNGKITIIPDLSLKINKGEFFTLLGPSGCGKTTFLRMIAGFNELNGGKIFFNEREINNIPAFRRNIGMVFQNYAVFPHLNTKDNVAYGLKLRNKSKEEIFQKVQEALEMVRMNAYADRFPDKLSGGQQQRIALARATVIDPDVLLMDEPLSNLDAKLRIEMRGSIRELQKSLGITTVYVTHDQEEALAISDRIAVIDSGIIQQIATPQTLYFRPSNEFVATFIGHSNLLHAKISKKGGKKEIVIHDEFRAEMNSLKDCVEDGQNVLVAMRTDHFEYTDKGGLKARIKGSSFLGKEIQYQIDFEEGVAKETEEGTQLVESIKYSRKIHKTGDEVRIIPDIERINVFTDDGSTNLISGAERDEEKKKH